MSGRITWSCSTYTKGISLKPAKILLNKQGSKDAGKRGAAADARSRSPISQPDLANSIIIDSMRSLLFLLALPVYAQNGTADGVTRDDWPHYGGTQFSWRYSALDQVNTSNVKNLLPAWIFQTGDYPRISATPIVADGVMYLISAARRSSRSTRPRDLIWQYIYPPRPVPAPGTVASP